jgi:hypothetical protein
LLHEPVDRSSSAACWQYEYVDIQEVGDSLGSLAVGHLDQTRPVTENFQQRDLRRAKPLAPAPGAGSPANKPDAAGVAGHTLWHCDDVVTGDLRRKAEIDGGAQSCRADA